MATYYALQQVGVADGTKIPSLKSDGRQVGAQKGVIVATKDNTNALAANDLVYLGKLRQGELVTDIKVLTDTSFGAVTLSVGTIATPGKYVNAVTQTVTGIPTSLGPLSAAVAAGPLTADEDIYLKVSGVVAAAVVASLLIEKIGIH